MNKSFHISRRFFLQRCSVVAAASGLPLWFVERDLAAAEAPPASASPNGRPGLGLIGCGGMGMGDAGNAARFGDILAVCDVDRNHAESAAKRFTKDGNKPAVYGDFRKLLERGDISAVVQATPDHWHTLINIAAAKAKKDVYGEKPLTLTIDEGHHVIQAVRENKIVFQTGTQQRSSPRFRLACELARNGRLGQLQQVNVFVPAGIRGNHFQKVSVPPEPSIIAGAGLDVLEGERELKEEMEILASEEKSGMVKDYKTLLEDRVLIEMPNVIITPHIAFYSKEAEEEIKKTTVENIKSFVDGKPINLVK